MHDVLNGKSDDNCKLDTHDLQPEIYWETDRSFAEFDKFESYGKVVEEFKKRLCTYDFSNNPKDSFYNAILFGLLFKLFKNTIKNQDTIIQTLGKESF